MTASPRSLVEPSPKSATNLTRDVPWNCSKAGIEACTSARSGIDMSSRGLSALDSQTRTIRSPFGKGSGRSVTVQARLNAVALAATPIAIQRMVRSEARLLRSMLRVAAVNDPANALVTMTGPRADDRWQDLNRTVASRYRYSPQLWLERD